MKNFSKLIYPYVLWMIIMIIVPMLMIVLYAFTVKGNDVLTLQFTFDNFLRFLSDDIFPGVLWRSLNMAFVTTVFCIAVGYPTAYFMASQKPNSAALMVLLMTLPTWINMLVRTYAWKGILTWLGTSGEFNVYVGMVYNFLPFMVLPLYNTLLKIDNDVLEAARDLGANNLQTFLHVTFPLSIPGIISGITMVFIPALTTFVISDLLGGGKILLIGNVIEQEFKQLNNWNVGSAMSMILMVFIVISMIITSRYDKDGEGVAF